MLTSVVTVPIEEEMRRSYLDYAMSNLSLAGLCPIYVTD